MNSIRILYSSPTKRDPRNTERVLLEDATPEAVEGFISASSFCDDEKVADQTLEVYRHLKAQMNASIKGLQIQAEPVKQVNKDGKTWTVFLNRREKIDYSKPEVLDGIVARLASAVGK